jgi:PPM family protein phosphatase
VSTLVTGTSGVGQLGAMLVTLWRRGADHFSRQRPVRAAGSSDVGRVRGNNEDYFVLADPARPAATVRGSDRDGAVTSSRPLLVVADGMGGAAGGEVASAMAANIICSHVEIAAREYRLRTGAQWRKTLTDAFVAANDRIRVRGEADAALRGMGTTATAVALAGDALYVAHVGDSRAYVIRDGRARRLTKDHTWLQYLIDAGRPDDTEAGDPRRNALLRALGTQPTVTVDVAHAEVRPGDTVILCTDGLWSVVDDAELARLVSPRADLSVLCRTLLALANDRGGNDNATVLAARMEP